MWEQVARYAGDGRVWLALAGAVGGYVATRKVVHLVNEMKKVNDGLLFFL